MDDTTRQLLHDAAPPVSTGTDFDALWQRAVRQRRMQRAAQAAAAVVLVALAGLVLPLGWGDSLPLLGRADGDRVEVEPLDGLRSAPLSEWDIQWHPGARGGPTLTSGNPQYALAVFAIEGGRWCIAAATSGAWFDDMGPVDPEIADRLLCHEVLAPTSNGPVGSVLAIEVGGRIVHVASVAVPPPSSGMGTVRVDKGRGMEAAELYSGGQGGGVPFGLWSSPLIGPGAIAFEFHSPTGESEAVTVEAPEPVPAEVVD